MTQDAQDYLTSHSGSEHLHADLNSSFGVKRENYQQVLYDTNSNKLALEAAQKAIVLVQNDNNLLPLKKDGFKNIAGKEIEVLHADGCRPDDFSAINIKEAVSTAREVDVVICTLGGNEKTCMENQDIDDLDFCGDQQKLLQEIFKVNNKIVLVLLHGRPNSIVWEKQYTSDPGMLVSRSRDGQRHC